MRAYEWSDIGFISGFVPNLWNRLHVDAMTNLGIRRLRKRVVDDKNYNSFDAARIAVAGWRPEAGLVDSLDRPSYRRSLVHAAGLVSLVTSA